MIYSWVLVAVASYGVVVRGSPVSSVTPQQLEKAMGQCGDSASSPEAISCTDAAGYVTQALNRFGLNQATQAAFYISVMDVESGKLVYNRNHFPGRPGQGTRSMMMPNNLYAFAKDVPDVLKENPGLQGVLDAPYSDGNDGNKEKLLKVLMQDKYSFLPGAWWIARGAGLANPECTRFKDQLAEDTSGGTEVAKNLLEKCVGVTATQDRLDAYSNALKALS